MNNENDSSDKSNGDATNNGIADDRHIPPSPPVTVPDDRPLASNYIGDGQSTRSRDQPVILEETDGDPNLNCASGETDAVQHQEPPIRFDMLLEGTGLFLDLDTADTVPTPSIMLGTYDEPTNWLDYNPDLNFLPYIMPSNPSAHMAYDKQMERPTVAPPHITASRNPPSSDQMMDQGAVTELYSRSHTPAIDQDAVELKHYHPVSIEMDAPLVFPDMSQLGTQDIDEEDLAHVDELPQEAVERVIGYATDMQRKPSFPPFIELRIPPGPVLNAWMQLYFEFFHPVFPILHKPSFTSKKRHWLLMFAVAAVGAQFSNIPDARRCSRAMHELVRRQSAAMCERENYMSRELWMLQTIVLNRVGLMYDGDRRSLEVAEITQALPITLARRKGFFNNLLPMQKFSQLQLPLTHKWQIWVLDEERRRLGFSVWVTQLLDAAFASNFELSRLVRVSELQIPLPQPDDRWAAANAQSWAGFSNVLEYNGSHGVFTIDQVVTNNCWKSAWTKTNTIGKQVILQRLTDIICSTDAPTDTDSAVEVLNDLLNMIESEQTAQAVDELKSVTTHQLMALTGLMFHNTPTSKILPIVVKSIYGKFKDEEWTQAAQLWRESGRQARLACYFAARIIHVTRSSHCPHFGAPVSLLSAVFILWIYSKLAQRCPDGLLLLSLGPVVVLGPKARRDMSDTSWVENGWSQIKMPGVGNLCNVQGRRKFLDEAILSMRSLKGWGISATYSQLLTRLRASEPSS
ncbi:hypothetical protein GCG54_00005215 [Colletotrichum gloeosporioides]|uniref:Xylanolytic transcriptional activator regulatory domain-containing protein n=1 Tax=Colletotrichum gloeosporioides TaxID=474922 RepID=A0A8H4C5A6_COLGL|nr:uncharacterized protein GCG54_00005215 [Colletotrichum gloeosporioides]KAF3797461.1 hypothetical protein GCG54_00005215 [Colletotrichum gloeosporioides]